jgi:hypothetical protein
MPSTPKYGFPFESPPFASPSTEPGETLHGGSTGTSDILAEKVEEELDRVDIDVQDLLARVEAIENGLIVPGWTHIQSGSNIGPNFDIDLTDDGKFSIGEFVLLRLHMRYDLTAEGFIRLLVNNDGGPSAYNGGMRVLDAANADPTGATPASIGVDVLNHWTSINWWNIGWGATVSTNNLICTILHTDATNLHNFHSVGGRMSTSATTHAEVTAWGNLLSSLSAAPSSLRIAPDGVEFSNSWWWVEGYRVP